jgi:Asp-tRNA(Asn)/Glu-tRNA(Gln) amidotransferase A subunit family amidase
LHGVPIGVKDIIDTVDMPTALGSAIYEGRRPQWDAACVAAVRAAGAIILGKTVTTEFAYFQPGKTRNPHDLRHTPGGSSSGSAAAVADFMVPLAYGSQTAASLIRPAAFCGVFGYKASFGELSLSGIRPFAESLDTLGIMARSVADIALVRSVLLGAFNDTQLAPLPHRRNWVSAARRNGRSRSRARAWPSKRSPSALAVPEPVYPTSRCRTISPPSSTRRRRSWPMRPPAITSTRPHGLRIS